MWGDLISNVIDFPIIAFIVFLAYKQLSKFKLVEDKTTPEPKNSNILVIDVVVIFDNCAFSSFSPKLLNIAPKSLDHSLHLPGLVSTTFRISPYLEDPYSHS
jgi:hypothetical protein